MLPIVCHMMARSLFHRIFIGHTGVKGRRLEASKQSLMEKIKICLHSIIILRNIKYEVAGIILNIEECS